MMQRLRNRNQDGLTLVELLVTMLLMSILSALILSAVVNSHKALRHNEDESQGLADVRKVVERLGRDIRDARGVAAGADASHLVLWIDYNSDYKQSSAETVTWQLRPARSAGHYEVIRQVGGSREIVEATYLVSAIAFSYDKPAPNTRLVTAAMTYDAVIGGAATQRTSSFSARLRNVS